MPKLYALCQMSGPLPNVAPLTEADFRGHVCLDRVGDYGAYLFSGTDAQLDALAQLPQVVEVARIGGAPEKLSAADSVGEAKPIEADKEELEKPVEKGKHAKLDAWLAEREFPVLVEGKTYRETVDTIYKRFNAHFDLNNFDVAE